MTRRFHVLLLDMMASARLADRNAATRRFRQVAPRLNRTFGADLLAPFEITRGDEVAGVLRSAARVYDIMAAMGEAMSPVRFRHVLAFGELTAGLETRRSSLIDGPAFYRADAMMRELKKTRKTFALASGQPAIDEPAEALVNLLQWRWSAMTDLQRRIVRLYQRERNQTRVGRELGRTQQQVSQALRSTRWELLEAGEEAVRRLFEQIDRGGPARDRPATSARPRPAGGSRA